MTAATARRPASAAAAGARGSPAGIVLDPGIISPSASDMIAIVEAVPIVLQAPVPQSRQRLQRPPAVVAEPPGAALVPQPPQRGAGADPLAPEDGGRAGAAGDHHRGDVRAGRAHDRAGHRLVAVGQDARSRPAGWPGSSPRSRSRAGCGTAWRSASSGPRRARSTPNSAGIPPASSTPRRTAPASSRSGRLHGFRSLAEFAMPITGRPPSRLTSRPGRGEARPGAASRPRRRR